MKYTVFLDRENLVKDEHFIETLTPGIFEGRGVFETMRVDDGHACFLDRHLERLRKGLKVLNIRLPYTTREIQNIVHKVLIFNQFKNARLRILAYQKHGSVGMAVMSLPRTVLSDRDYFDGYAVTTAKCPSRAAKYANVKSLDYGRYYQAYHAARDKGFNEALLINPKGFVFEASRSNVFYFKKGTLHTPSLALGCLNGLTRQLVIDCSRAMRIPVKQSKPQLNDILDSDEVFLTNSLIGVMPITRIDVKRIHSGRIGDATYQIRSAYLKKLILPKLSLTSAMTVL
jgi:branched-chain amino acid aminotransferase